jgi:type IV fimbrial biogenesis protein FimT
MSLIEIMVAVAIVAILFAAAAPDFSNWIQNTKIRNAAEAMQNGLTLAKTEAVHRNTVAQFVSCGASSWQVIAASSASASAVVCGTNSATTGLEIVQERSISEGSNNASVVTTQTTIGFNGLGRQASTTDIPNGLTTSNPPVAVNFDISNSTAGATCFCPAGTCGYPVALNYSSTGTLRCLRVTVSSGGQIRMCDPALLAGSPQGC